MVDLTARSIGFLRQRESLTLIELLDELDEAKVLAYFKYDRAHLVGIKERSYNEHHQYFEQGKERWVIWEAKF